MSKLSIFVLIGFFYFGFTNPEPEKIYKINTVEYIYEYCINEVPQVVFWRKIMNLPQDSCLVNVHSNRKILATLPYQTWDTYKGLDKEKVIDSFRNLHGLVDSPKIVGTQGKNFFYLFEKVADKVPVGMKAFEDNELDGWYAKAILLIESPNQLQKSPAGAYGAFQLMPSVAKKFGLKVNSKIDERKDFNKSAYAASQLIKTVCIPYADSMLNQVGLKDINHDELWFKLFVMHIYNAGAYNVKAALNTIPEPEKSMKLIYKLWNTSAGRFKNASQNYSQLILAAFLEYDERIDKKLKD